MAQVFEITLDTFEFPAGLDNNRANFRFIIDIRYVTPQEEFAAEHVVMPGLDTFWECDETKSGEPNYVRVQGGHSFDGNKLDAWDRLVLVLSAERLHSLQLKVFDVNRKDAWDEIKGAIGPLLESVLGKVKSFAPGMPSFVANALGSAAEDVQSFALKKLAGGGDKVLFRGSASLPTSAAGAHQTVKVSGPGSRGTYTATFRVSPV